MARLKLYRRHLATCPHKHKGMKFDRCKCPIWIRGTWAGEPMRKSLDVDTWPKAEELKRNIEDGIKPKRQSHEISIAEAYAAFLSDCGSRNLKPNTIGKYKRLGTRLCDYAASRGIPYLSLFAHEHIVSFRGTWQGSPRTLSATLEKLRQFFRFCINAGWIEKSPALGLKGPKNTNAPRLPFSDKEIKQIISRAEDDRELAFLLTLRYTGLRIGDASLLRTSHFSEDRIYIPATQKAHTPVSVLIPPNLASLLKALPAPGGYFFLRGESTNMTITSDLWRRRIKKICKELKITPDHPHRFRHTLAADLLSRGVSVENVAAILGNSPTIVIRHYSQWIRSRQDALDAALQSTWGTTKLARVK